MVAYISVQDRLGGVNLQTVGYICMAAGALGIILIVVGLAVGPGGWSIFHRRGTRA